MRSAEQFFAPCPRGLEGPLAAELHQLDAREIHVLKGGVSFVAPYFLCYRINLESRIASRVLWRISHANYRDEQDIYDTSHELPWLDWFSPERSIRINVSAIKSPLKSLDFVALRIKDAICDAFRSATGIRPHVDKRNPDVRIHAFLTANELTLYIDTSGDALFKRGYRTGRFEAPLRENLAAGILRLIGWKPEIPLLDPMCGSGTFLTEAAMISSNTAPGARRRFGFEKLKLHDHKTWQTMRSDALARTKKTAKTRIFGSDSDGNAVRQAHANLTRIGMEHFVHLKRADVLEMPAPATGGIIVTNPPYGLRMEEQRWLADFYPLLGDTLKKNYSGWIAYIFSADLRLPKFIRLSASKRTPLYNGPLDCRLFQYRLVAGSMRKGARRV